MAQHRAGRIAAAISDSSLSLLSLLSLSLCIGVRIAGALRFAMRSALRFASNTVQSLPNRHL